MQAINCSGSLRIHLDITGLRRIRATFLLSSKISNKTACAHLKSDYFVAAFESRGGANVGRAAAGFRNGNGAERKWKKAVDGVGKVTRLRVTN